MNYIYSCILFILSLVGIIWLFILCMELYDIWVKDSKVWTFFQNKICKWVGALLLWIALIGMIIIMITCGTVIFYEWLFK